MDSTELQKLAQHARSMREAGITLLISSGLLTIFLFMPVGREQIAVAPPGNGTAGVEKAFSSVSVLAKAAIVYDLATGETLYEKNANAQLPLASLTKLLTVYASLAELPLKTLIAIPSDATRLEGPRAFPSGETFTLLDLVRLTLTASLNDGASAIAEAAATRKSRTRSELLANAASSLGLPQTYAVNGNGLDVNIATSGGYGSAHDVARLAGALVLVAPEAVEATTRLSASAVSANGKFYMVQNTNPMVDTIPGLLLSKTGYTDLAGGNLALVLDAGIGHLVAIVVLGSSQAARFSDANTLLGATFAHFAGLSSYDRK